MRLYLLIMALMVALILTACGGRVSSEDTTGAGSNMTAASAIGNSITATIQVTDVWARATSMMSGSEVSDSASTDASMGEAQATDEIMATEAMGTAQQTDTAMSGNIGALYMTIRNTGNTSDRLLKVQSAIASSVELHASSEANGVMQMRPLDGIDVPANGEVTLKPGGIHVMLIGLKKDLRPGDKVAIKLQFERRGAIVVQADVRVQ